MTTLHTLADRAEAASGAMREAMWAELKARCCADPKKAKRCVMVSKADFDAAFRTGLRALAAGEGKG